MMTKRILLFCFLLGTVFFFQACNPECETLPTSNIVIPPGPYLEGSELAIAANPPSVIEGRRILMSLNTTAGVNTVELASRFEESIGAAVVELPQEINSSATFLIDDPDCSGQLIPIGASSSLVGESFFIDNPFFVTPIPPLIVIPVPPVNLPQTIVNAWFSPNNKDYCIWFKPEDDGNGGELPNLVPAISTGPSTFTNGPPDGSIELAVGCGGMPAVDRIYHGNPVTGIVDVPNNFIRIIVDRTNKDLGTEEFVGQFVNPDFLPTGYNLGGPNGDCGPGGNPKPNIMFLTSVQTGRQLVLYRGLD